VSHLARIGCQSWVFSVQLNKSPCCCPPFPESVFFLNNLGLTNLWRLSRALFHVVRRPRPQDAGTPLLLAVFTSELDPRPGEGLHWQINRPQSLHRPWLLQSFNLTVQCNCNACNVPPDAGIQKRANFSTIIVGLSGTGDQTRASKVAGSGTNRSAIHYDSFPAGYNSLVEYRPSSGGNVSLVNGQTDRILVPCPISNSFIPFFLFQISWLTWASTSTYSRTFPCAPPSSWLSPSPSRGTLLSAPHTHTGFTSGTNGRSLPQRLPGIYKVVNKSVRTL
jgi:hypothetical protein